MKRTYFVTRERVRTYGENAAIYGDANFFGAGGERDCLSPRTVCRPPGSCLARLTTAGPYPMVSALDPPGGQGLFPPTGADPHAAMAGDIVENPKCGSPQTVVVLGAAESSSTWEAATSALGRWGASRASWI
jgi:hypothetical protein